MLAAQICTMDAMSRTRVDATSISDGSAKALTKGLLLVDLVAERSEPIRLVDLVTASGLPRPTALRLLEVLVREGVLRTDAAGAYALGPHVTVWGQAFLDRLDLREQARDLVDELVGLTGETCFVGVLDRSSVLYVVAVNSPQPVRPAARIGSRNPLHCTGIGKAILAGLSDQAVAEHLVLPLERRTPNTITELPDLLEHLGAVRAQGFAEDHIENEDGVRCVAAPVRDHSGQVVAGLSVSAPAYRFADADLGRWAPHVLRVADELSARLGYSGSAREVAL